MHILTDPLVQLLPTLLEDASAADSLQIRLSTLRVNSEAGDVEAVRDSFDSVRAAVVSYAPRTIAHPADLPTLTAVGIAVQEAERVFRSLAPAGAPLATAADPTGHGP